MSKRVKVGRNEPCPCGSGKKYKTCCYDKGFTYMVGEDGEVVREVPMTDEMRELLTQQLVAFKEKFGRDPGPNDKVFWDEPEHVEHGIVQAMREANLPPRFIYAFEKTGRLVSEENLHLIPQADLDEWTAACEEYDRMYPERHG